LPGLPIHPSQSIFCAKSEKLKVEGMQQAAKAASSVSRQTIKRLSATFGPPEASLGHLAATFGQPADAS